MIISLEQFGYTTKFDSNELTSVAIYYVDGDADWADDDNDWAPKTGVVAVIGGQKKKFEYENIGWKVGDEGIFSDKKVFKDIGTPDSEVDLIYDYLLDILNNKNNEEKESNINTSQEDESKEIDDFQSKMSSINSILDELENKNEIYQSKSDLRKLSFLNRRIRMILEIFGKEPTELFFSGLYADNLILSYKKPTIIEGNKEQIENADWDSEQMLIERMNEIFNQVPSVKLSDIEKTQYMTIMARIIICIKKMKFYSD